MILIGLTGGIGSGKSTVARLLADKGAVVIDADVIGHEVQAPGGPVHQKLVERFGSEVCKPDGAIDRQKLAKIVFQDRRELEDLNAITHPQIYREILARIDEFRDTGRLVVLDAPLLVETTTDRGRSMGMSALVVVAAKIQDQIERLAAERAMLPAEARARIDAQASQSAKMAAADYVIDNRGTLEGLRKSVDVLYDRLVSDPHV